MPDEDNKKEENDYLDDEWRHVTSEDDESELPDTTHLADQNTYVADEEANRGENHPSDSLPEDNSIKYQDPEARLSEELA